MLRFLIIVFYFFLFSEAAYAKDSKGLFEQLVILAERGHEINFDNEAKNFGYKNFSVAVKDYKKEFDVRISTEEAKSLFNDILPEGEIEYTKENADKLFEVIINSKYKSAKRYKKKYLTWDPPNGYKAFAITLNIKREFSRITKDPNIKSIAKHTWTWWSGSSKNLAVNLVMNACEADIKKYRIPFQECMVIDINGDNVLYEFIPHIREAAINKRVKDKILLAEKEKEEANKKKAEEAKKKKAEELKKKRAGEEKKRLEKEKLEANRKADEEKKRLLEEKIKQQKALDEKKLSLLPAKPIEEKAKKALIDIQKFIKNNPDEFDILEISEFFIKTKPILENSFNEQLEKDLNSLIEYVKKSKNFQSYLLEIEIKEREKNLKYIDEKLSLINEQIAIVTNYLYEKPNSTHAEIWLNSVKMAKQQLNNFNSLDALLTSSNDLSIIISNQENLVKLNAESKKLIIELKDYLAENLTTDLAPKILEQIDRINKSIETEDQSQIKIANQNAEILLKSKRKAEKDKLEAKQKAEEEKYKKEKKELEGKQKAEKEKKTKIAKSFKTNYDSIMDAYHSDVDKFLNLVPKIRNNARRMSYDTYATCSIATIYAMTQEAQGYIKLNSETQLTWAISLKLTQIFQNHHLSKGFPQSVLDEIINSKKSMFIHNGENFKLSLIKECSDWVDSMVAKSK